MRRTAPDRGAGRDSLPPAGARPAATGEWRPPVGAGLSGVIFAHFALPVHAVPYRAASLRGVAVMAPCRASSARRSAPRVPAGGPREGRAVVLRRAAETKRAQLLRFSVFGLRGRADLKAYLKWKPEGPSPEGGPIGGSLAFRCHSLLT